MNMFDEQYITTIGTRVSKKEVQVSLATQDLHLQVDMMIWDIMGEKGFRELLKDAYFYGANGILAVADLTRRRTLDDLDDWIDGVAPDREGPGPDRRQQGGSHLERAVHGAGRRPVRQSLRLRLPAHVREDRGARRVGLHAARIRRGRGTAPSRVKLSGFGRQESNQHLLFSK